jgi:EAL domain-containing protein (putative c-di-GMP-specific phosphodiesterase class I)
MWYAAPMRRIAASTAPRILQNADLHRALAESRIGALYQPIVHMENGLPVGLETLARLEDPDHGTLGADHFVPQIEDAGLAWPLTETVARQAFMDWGDGRLRRLGLTLALNVPLDVLLIPATMNWLETHRTKAGLAPDEIVIELTESRPVDDLPALAAVIAALRRTGYGLAIDDVGPAVPDYESLLRLEFSALKLDKNLVQDSGSGPIALELLTRVTRAAAAAGLVVIAEGVENATTWDRVRKLGAHHAQGFFVARPLPASGIAAWHQDWSAPK